MMRKYFSLLTLILLSFGVYAGGAPSNDACSDASTLSCGATISNESSDNSVSQTHGSGCSMANYGLWYTFVGDGQQTTISATTSSYDIEMAIASGSCGSLSNIDCIDDAFSSGTESYTFVTTNGVTYYVYIANWSSSSTTTGDFDISRTCTTAPTPPSNDECSGATAVTVNPDLNCGSVTAGTIQNATGSAQANACGSGSTNDDVWYSFVATGTVHTVDLLNVTGSTTDLYHSVYVGTCASIGAPLVCSDPNSSSVTGLTPGNTYYVRVYSYGTSSGATTTFNICVGTPPPPPANDLCANATSLSCGTSLTNQSTVNTTNTAHGTSCFMSDYGVWYTFVGDGNNTTITVSNSYDIELSISSGSCGAFTNIVCTDSPENHTFTTVNGLTYYVYVAYWTTGTTTGTFDISRTCTAAPSPPPNDNCGNAISLTMSTDGSCNSVSSTVASATNSLVSACGGTANDDVWFSFVATNDSAYVDRIADFDSEIEVFDGCSGTSLGCQDSESSILITGLTVGNTYYVRVHSWSSTVPNPGDADFTICVFGPAPPPENDLCSKMQPICADSPYSFIATQGGDDASTTEPGNDYDCLSTSPNPTWFFLEIDTGGVMSFDITAADDIDFALWGPYTSLTNAKAACGSLPVPIDCSYSSTNIEQANANVSAGDVFILLVTNYADVQQPITLNSSSANTASTDCTILPIELMSFVANASENGNELSWQTLTEINNDYFILETSKDARNFEAIANVDGAGNSNELMNYYFIDNNPIASVTYYRLKQVDFDGKFSYSDVVSVRRIEDGEAVISPNPVKDVLNIELKTTQAGNYNFMVVDLLGAVIEKNIHLNKGTNNIKLDVFADLPQGFYMLKIMDENNTIITTKKIVKN